MSFIGVAAYGHWQISQFRIVSASDGGKKIIQIDMQNCSAHKNTSFKNKQTFVNSIIQDTVISKYPWKARRQNLF